ncbi:non-ribosomal peptide synthetase [Streptomyces sp. NPDC001920]
MNHGTFTPDGAQERVGHPAPCTGPPPGGLPGSDPVRAAVVGTYPLTVLQTGMVFHQELDPHGLPYHNVRSLLVRAPLDPAVLRRAVQDVVERHPVLRTAFDLSDHEEPLQLVHRSVELPLECEDLRGLSAEKQVRVLGELAEAERTRPFDVTRPPLVRLFAHRLTDDTFRWTQTEHHALLDGPSRTAFRAEVLDRYRRLLDDPAAPAEPEPAATFREFVSLERRTAASEEVQRFWADALAGCEPCTLPHRPEEHPAAPHGTVECEIPGRTVESLRDLAERLGVPLRSVLLTAHAKTVGIATGRHDIVTGVVTDGRPEGAAGAGALGMYLNVSPVRVDLTGSTWGGLVRQVHDADAAARPFRRYPLAAVTWDRDGGELFDHVVDFAVDEPDVELRAEPTGHTLSTTFLDTPGGGLRLRLDHATDRVCREQAEDVRDAYLTVLAALPDTEARHEHLCPLTESAYRLMLKEWNGPARAYPVDRCVHELFEEQVRRVPDALAVTDGTLELSYAELNRRANRLARRLRQRGAGPESVVAVLCGRTTELVVLLLAVLKSGAAYLPLEPQYPAERLRYLLEDSGARLVLAEERFAERVPEGPWTVWHTARAAEEAAGLADGDLGRTSSPDNLMYVIYTSGSTGLPKGVLVPHFGVVNYLGWCKEGYAARGSGGAPVFSSIAFDMIVPNLYTPLVTGERLCMLDDSLDSVALADRLDELAPFTFVKMTPGHLDLLDQLLPPERARSLATTLAVGADTFPTRILDSWRRKDPDSVILNEYGPTEASVGNTVHFVDKPVTTEQVPIGRAIPNTTMYVLDPALNPVPLGVTGELYIGGDCVVRGYAGRPRLTAEKFVPDPFSEAPGARMYRTGDLGRWMPGGALEFLGRDDGQLKVNGYRVELGEIEAALVAHPAVKQSVAAVIGTDQKTPRLVGYYMSDEEIDEQDLLAHLAERLPAYMVPGIMTRITTLPLNANGKVDRRALPTPRALAEAGYDGRAVPSGEAERAVAAVWQDLLYLDQVWRTDDFVTLGGNSLLAVQLVFRLRRQGIEVSLAEVMRPVTLADLAAGAVLTPPGDSARSHSAAGGSGPDDSDSFERDGTR